jgi:alpha-galactosidase
VRCPNMTEAEYQTAFSLWTLAASPLIVDADVRNLSDFQRRTLLHPEMLAIHHDKDARGGSRVGLGLCSSVDSFSLLSSSPSSSSLLSSVTTSTCTTQVWVKPLAGNATAIALYNSANTSSTLAFSFALLGEVSSRLHVRDVWGQQDLGTSVGSFRTPFAVEPHGTAVLVVSHNGSTY